MKDKLTQLKKTIYKKYSPELKIKNKKENKKKSNEIIEDNFNLIPNQIDLDWNENTFRFSRNKRKYFIYFLLFLFGLNMISFFANSIKEDKLESIKNEQKIKEQKELMEAENKLKKLSLELEKKEKDLQLKNKKIEKLNKLNKNEKLEKIKEILNK